MPSRPPSRRTTAACWRWAGPEPARLLDGVLARHLPLVRRGPARSCGTRRTRASCSSPRSCTCPQPAEGDQARDVRGAPGHGVRGGDRRRAREAPRPGQDGTWITDEMQGGLRRRCTGWASRTPSRPGQDGKLVGGLYGVSLGAAFFGESMFARAPDASKVAFVTLVRAAAASGASPRRLPGGDRAPGPLRRRALAAPPLPRRAGEGARGAHPPRPVDLGRGVSAGVRHNTRAARASSSVYSGPVVKGPVFWMSQAREPGGM